MSALCPRCGSESITRKGTRTNMSGKKTIFMCRRCRKRFVERPSWKYPKHLLVHVLNSYTLGMTQAEIASDLRRRYRSSPSRTTVQRWLSEHEDICPMRKYRERLTGFEEVIREHVMVHRGIPYRFGLNLFKLQLLKSEMKGLGSYLINFRDGPMFDEGSRCSEVPLNVNVNVSRTKNIACRFAEVGFSAARTGPERHPMVEDLMLVNDLATIAKEVPIHFHLDGTGDITGHIDLIQHRFGKLHILDIKPESSKEHPEAQLLLYALGLSQRTGIPISSMECAWFDEKYYFHFDPSKAVHAMRD